MTSLKSRPARHRHAVALPGLFALALFLMSACASSGPSIAVIDDNLSQASTAVAEAEEVGAQEHAPLALSDAKDKLEAAQQAKADGKNAKAMRLADEAEVDAEYAEMKALSTKAELAADELRQSIQTLRQEIERGRSN